MTGDAIARNLARESISPATMPLGGKAVLCPLRSEMERVVAMERCSGSGKQGFSTC